MQNTLLGILASTLVFCAGCKDDDKKVVSTSHAGKSQKAADKKPIEKKEINDDNVKQVPNQFPLKDGKLPKNNEQKKSGNNN
ncbi:hypothetical protein AAEU29_08255 [Pseudoalteromonas sp. SSM20]|uniref:hypothetical protein n=1 Tax=Pseudoalteromonas sp. SSM20 TaxID=3139394 RepID=UPI003BAAF045